MLQFGSSTYTIAAYLGATCHGQQLAPPSRCGTTLLRPGPWSRTSSRHVDLFKNVKLSRYGIIARVTHRCVLAYVHTQSIHDI